MLKCYIFVKTEYFHATHEVVPTWYVSDIMEKLVNCIMHCWLVYLTVFSIDIKSPAT